MPNSRGNKYVLNFKDINNSDVAKLVRKLRHQRMNCGLKYTLLKAGESDIIILVYPANEKTPRPSEFENFKSFKGYKIFTELEDVIKFNKGKKIAFKKANIRIAKTADNKSVYWIKYI